MKTAWQPIETAPQDGTVILTYDPKEILEGVGDGYAINSWDYLGRDPKTDHSIYGFFGTPEFWMPLPVPPTNDQG